MDCEKKKHPIVGIEGYAASGKQFDLDITIPEDNRDVIYGIVRDACKEPICDAVVKLIEVDKHCKEDRKPVSHTFTDKYGEFVFGPLCSDKCYSIEIWANLVEHIKICAKCHREGKCLKGIPMGHCDYFFGNNEKKEEDYKEEYKDEEKKTEKPCYKEYYEKEDEKKDYKPCKKEDDKDIYEKKCETCEKDDKKDDDKKEYKTNSCQKPYCR